ncbi:MAG TPA: phosphatidate cytidylyltransferase [Candidatus Limnocylindria bacterium]|jgi:phosphatidate cytidylyltransferase|nr:phosphatidate cytidylyltransferase [Candidatus Limnocylindria bacterium]
MATTPAPGAAPAAASRAGRNLPLAIGVGVSLVILILLSLLSPLAFTVLVAVALGVAAWELCTALAAGDIRVPLVPVLLGGTAMYAATYAAGTDGLVIGLALSVIAVLVWRLFDGADGYLRDVSGGLFVLGYLPLLAGFAVLMVTQDQGVERIVTFILVVVASDVGGYALGVLFGKHPMAPRISPKKSWEGFGGSVLFCAVAGAIALPLLLEAPWWQGLLLGLALVCTAVLGDLCESMVKRDLGVKDMGNLLPGHGGLMDRLDSLLLSAPVAWLLLSVFVGL